MKSRMKSLNIITVHYYLVVILILSIILKIKLGISIKNAVCLFMTCSIIMIFPSYEGIRHWYYHVKICCLLAITVITIWISPIPFEYKVLTSASIIYMYYRSLRLIIGTISVCISSVKTPKLLKHGDLHLRNMIREMYVNTGFHLKDNFDAFPDFPCILIANYCRSRAENPLSMLLPRRMGLLMQDGFEKHNLHKIIDKAIYVRGHGKGNFQIIKDKVKESIDEGRDVFAYINSPSYYNYIGKMKSGLFQIAIDYQIPILPVAFDIIDTVVGIVPNQNMCIKIGKSFIPRDIYSGKYNVRNFFNETLKEFKENKYNPDYKV